MSHRKQQVLIVDDSQTNLTLLDHMLAQEGCEVVQARSGIEAVEMVRNNDFALILLDIQMPGMNGYDTALRIKEQDRGRHVPIIFVTAIFQDEDNVRQGYETGAVDYLFRPVDVMLLKSKVQAFLKINKQQVLLRREIEQRKKTEQALRLAEEKYRSIFERAVEGIFQSSLDGMLMEANPAMVRLFGYDSAEEMAGIENLREALMVDADERRTYVELLRRDGFVANFEFRARRKSGEIIWCSESSRLVRMGEDGREYVEGVLEDITKRKHSEFELKHLATMDSLTGVPNRHIFFDRLELAVAAAKRYGSRPAVLFVDLNDFKEVNDTLGHQAGDDLLCMVAGRLQKRIREADTLARLGGDEFGVLLADVENEEGALIVARNLIAVLEEPFSIQNKQIRVGATIGISYFPDDGKDGVTLVSRADAAMYGAKKNCHQNVGTFRDCGAPK
ncbi:diguanylate cyclase [Pseudodesulfovibrio sp.]|uniref:GGDEF domain-containing response regulator n=1 Tax=Pseudodesulfovibrio sp. TaxID=2035812 RepID=UPI00262CA88C|nr:diguanylate cyclase [Pseudodesulfovibrio sp.]MDD3312471.1 diguanylate cyclase [Pseudodesulfovibrio sp.]